MAHDHEGPQDPAEDARIAKAALASGDLGHALFHAGGALSSDPSSTEYLAILDEILSRADDAVALLEGKNDFVNASVRAYALAKKNRLADALSLIVSVARARPDIGYLAWAREWLSKPGAATSLDQAQIGACVVGPMLGMLQKLPMPVPEQHPTRTNLSHALAMLDVVRELHPKMPEAYVATALALRRAGRIPDAVKVAESAINHAPAWQSWVALGCARRDAKDLDGACEAFTKAADSDKSDASALLDVGDLRLEQGKLEDALSAYEAALERRPDDTWATPSAAFARSMLKGDAASRELLLDGAAADPESRAAALVVQLGEGPFVGRLPGPSDATAKVVDMMRADVQKGETKKWTGTMKLAVTSLESPSVRTAFDMQVAVLGLDAKIEISVGEIPKPDPREPREGGVALWKWDDTTPSPAVDPPTDEAVKKAVVSLASRAYHRDVWARVAARTAKELSPTELVAVMVHPPPVPKHWPFANFWIQRIQTAAAMLLAFADRDKLRAVALGQPDWTVEAAVVALAAHALLTKEERDTQKIFETLLAKIPRPGHCAYELALATAWQWLAISDERKKDLEARARDL